MLEQVTCVQIEEFHEQKEDKNDLFNLYSETIPRETKVLFGFIIGRHNLSNIRYKDNSVDSRLFPFCIPYPYRTWEITVLHHFLSFVTLIKACLSSLYSHSFTQARCAPVSCECHIHQAIFPHYVTQIFQTYFSDSKYVFVLFSFTSNFVIVLMFSSSYS